MNKNQNIEELFRDALGNYEADTSPGTWEQIQAGLKVTNSPVSGPSGLGSGISKGLWFKLGLGVIGTAALVTSLYIITGPSENKVPAPVEPKNIATSETNTRDKVDQSDNLTAKAENNSKPVENQPNIVVPVENKKPENPEHKRTSAETSGNTSKPIQPVETSGNQNITGENKTKDGNQGQPEKLNKPEFGNPPVQPKTGKPKTNAPEVLNSSESGVYVPVVVKKNLAKIKVTAANGVAPLVVTFSNESQVDNMLWNFGDGSPASVETSPVHVFEKPGKYIVTLSVKDETGETHTASELIEVNGQDLFLPNSFTPNGDGINDEFRITDEINIRDFTIVIQDKQGKIVSQWSGFEGFWDGRNLKGEICPPGTYIYVLNYTDWKGQKLQKIGTITIPNNR